MALSTANLYSAVQPGGSLYGLQASNPVDPSVAYKGPSANFGGPNDPMVGNRIGGVNVFGGGVPLYAAGGVLVGGLGVSGDTSCPDHFIAWRVRNLLKLDYCRMWRESPAVPNIPIILSLIFDISNGSSAGGFGHPKCINTGDPSTLPAVR